MSYAIAGEAYVDLLARTAERLARLEYVACPALHGNRQATELRAELGMIRDPPASKPGIKDLIKRRLPWLVLAVYCLRRTGALLLLRGLSGRTARTVESADIVLRSWAVSDLVDRQRDFYFGDVPLQLEQLGRKVVRLVRRAGRSSQLRFDLRLLWLRDPGLLPEDVFVPPLAPFRIYWHLLGAWWSLRFTAAGRETEPQVRIVERAVLRDLSSIDTAVALEIREASRGAASRLRPRVYLTFYEGYSWEQCAWRGIEEAEAGCLIGGFNHTILCPASYALMHPRQSSWRRTVPDVIFCAGDAQRDLLAVSHRGLPTRVETLGSPRLIADAQPRRASLEPACDLLVLPEGIVEECRLLIELIAQAAALSPATTFLLRLHPVLPFEALPVDLRALVEARQNISVSREDFATAVGRCRGVLYRGSSAVLQAMHAGLVPVQYDAAGTDDVDPLWREHEARATCSTAEELIAIARRESATYGNPDRTRRMAAAAARYARPFQAETMRWLADAAGCCRT